MRLLMICLSIFSLLLSGCKIAPKKPTFQMCFLDLKRNECVCGLVNGELVESSNQITFLDAVHFVYSADGHETFPAEKCDKSVVLPLPSWEILQNYTHDLENFIRYQCK